MAVESENEARFSAWFRLVSLPPGGVRRGERINVESQPVPKNRSRRKLRANNPCIRARTYVP